MCDRSSIPVLRSKKHGAGGVDSLRLRWEHLGDRSRQQPAMASKQLALRPLFTERGGEGGGGVDGKAAAAAAAAAARARERSSLTNASFRVYYSLCAGAVPFLWESAPGTPKSGASAGAAELLVPPPISPPPSYQSSQLRGCRPRSSSPATAGGVVRELLLGMCGLGKGHRRSRRRLTAGHL